MTNKDLPHDPRAETQDMSAVLPGSLALAQEPQISFVHQSSGLQGVPGAFAFKIIGSKSTQFFVYAGHEATETICVGVWHSFG
jgi:hypothetical protein